MVAGQVHESEHFVKAGFVRNAAALEPNERRNFVGEPVNAGQVWSGLVKNNIVATTDHF